MKSTIDQYYYNYGEGSCQHSFTTSFCMTSKYDDRYCDHDGFLHIWRNGLSDEGHRVYLFPIGSYNDKDKLKQAINNLIDDAHSNSQKVIFNSLTESAKNKLELLYNDKFVVEEERDLFEYIYNVEDLAYLNGPQYYNKRNEVKSFFRKYGEETVIRQINDEDLSNIIRLSKDWLELDEERTKNKQLLVENKALDIALKNYKELNILGLVVYVGTELAGFIIGAKLNADYIDAMIEKGNRKFKGIYRILNKEFPRICCEGYKYINLEEDLGIEGLRNMKLLYHPSHYIKKYIAKEI